MFCCKRSSSGVKETPISLKHDTVARKYLRKRIIEVRKGRKKDLINWRLQDAEILQALQDYCSNDQNDYDDPDMDEDNRKNLFMEETQGLFDRVNHLMAIQERSAYRFPGHKTALDRKIESEDEYVSIVFCGKEATNPRSLSELLVNRLSETCLQVYTVSRSAYEPTRPNIKHVQCKTLTDEGEDGVEGFANVIRNCIDEYFPIDDTSQVQSKKRKLVIYFTMGFYKRDKALQDNVISATNLSNALVNVLSNRTGKIVYKVTGSDTDEPKDKDKDECSPIKWKVIVTGTDATLHSEMPDQVITMKDAGTTTPYTIAIPKYKIAINNYVYAMSKLGQFYAFAEAISRICSEEHVTTQGLTDTLKKITQHVNAAGNDALYHEEANNIITMKQLDTLSKTWLGFHSGLIATAKHLAVVEDLTIMFTPLHIVPWVEEAVSKRNDKDEFKGSMKARIVNHILFRFRNAISIETGVAYHMEHM